jgi:Cu+-exporting ATPase
MNMIHGTLVVEPTGESAPAEPLVRTDGVVPGESSAGATTADEEAAQAAERRAEILDLTRRVITGAANPPSPTSTPSAPSTPANYSPW